MNENSSTFPPFDAAEQVVSDQILGASFHVAGLSLQQLITDQTNRKLVVAKFIKQGASDGHTVRLEWECVTDQGNLARVGTRYWAELNTVSWLIDRCGLYNSDGGKYLKTIDYQPYEGGHFPKLITATFTQPKVSVETEVYQLEPPHPCTQGRRI